MKQGLEDNLTIITKIEHAIDLITKKSMPIEILCKKNLSISTGYFDNRDKAVAVVLANNGKSEIYITLNKIDGITPDKIQNKLVPSAPRSSNDDIIKRNWLFIDVDPVRKTNTQATEYQRQYSKALAQTIIDDLIDLYQWPKPLFADSGNGCHILFPINLVCNDSTDELVSKVLQAIKLMYEEEGFKIDTNTSDRARQVRLYGTINTKGIGDVRESEILSEPSQDRHITKEQLEFYAEQNGYKFGGRAMAPIDFDIDAFLRKNNIDYKKREGTNTIRWFVQCPNNPDHNIDGKPAILHYKNQGTYGFKCHHESCRETGIYEYIKGYSPVDAEIVRGSNKGITQQYPNTIDGYIDAINDLINIGAVDKLRLDTFTNRVVVGDDLKTPLNILVSSVNMVMNRAVKGTKFASIDLTRQAMELISYNNQFDSAIEWANELKWDNVPRLSRFFIDIYGAPNTPSMEAITKEFFTGVMRRVFWPGAVMDECLLILGPQGVGKSKGLQLLGGPFFAEYNSDPTNTVNYAAVANGRILIEFSEGAAFKGLNNNDKKAFISRNTDAYRRHYTHELFDAPRRYGIIITSNKYQFLNDFTGERRYWVVALPTRQVFGKEVNDRFKYIQENRTQLWAEAAHYALNQEKSKNVDGFVVAEHRDTDREDIFMDVMNDQSAHKSILDTPAMEGIVDLLEIYQDQSNKNEVIGSMLLDDFIWYDESKHTEIIASPDNILKNLFDKRTVTTEDRRQVEMCLKELGFKKNKIRRSSFGRPDHTIIRCFTRELKRDQGPGYIPQHIQRALEKL